MCLQFFQIEENKDKKKFYIHHFPLYLPLSREM